MKKIVLSNYKLGNKRNFGYASILVAFFFERVPALSPRVRLLPSPPREPRLTWWGDVFLHEGGGEIQCGYDDGFYAWWIH